MNGETDSEFKNTDTNNENTIPNQEKRMNSLKKQFDDMVQNYLESNPYISTQNTNEFEIRFGSNPKLSKPISKIDYDNVVKQLYSCGFKPEVEEGVHLLRIQNEYIDFKSGITKMSNIRAEIAGIDMIQEYCRTNSLQKLIDLPSTVFNKLKFTQKTLAKNDSKIVKPLDMPDFNFRVSHQLERDYNIHTNTSRNIISKWADSKKIFRCMNRVRFYHPEYPIFADLSIIKTSKKTNKIPIPHYTIQEAGVFNNVEHYEIELEIDNGRVGNGGLYDNLQPLLDALRKTIRIVLSGLQGSKYPISYFERDMILEEYMRVIHGDEYVKRRVFPKDFIGPSSYTLQLDNILLENETSTVPNIRTGYTVTDKADGDRKLLFISKVGKIYLIDTNMNVIFTGSHTKVTKMFNSIIDGEHIKYDKNGNFINLYACFDVYYINNRSIREYRFVSDDETITECRLLILNQMIELMKPTSIESKKSIHTTDSHSSGLMSVKEINTSQKRTDLSLYRFKIQCKTFYMGTNKTTIFEGCSAILSKIKEGIYEYNTDGLIFTPIDKGVASNEIGKAGPLYKTTWEQSFKWKPAEYNTIDFLVSTKKDKNGNDELHHIFQEGRNLQGTQEVIQYKTLILRCGYDESKHGFINPAQNIIDDKLPSPDDLDNESKYKPVPFQPTNPYDVNACYCNIILREDGNKLYLMTEEHQYFEEDMIVEFKYVETNKDGWKWIPLRVRYDKTSLLRSGVNEFGNAYHVANSNWQSIHHPITEAMITTGEDIPLNPISEDVYYNRSNEDSSTQALRNFHNLFVKKNLILGVARRGDTLIDMAVGKAGDLSKWIRAKLSFVFGIDYSKDNIYNNMDGACARYLKSRRKNKNMHDAIFIHGNSSLNIRSGKAFHTEKDKQISNAIFGNGPKDAQILGKGIYKQYGVAQNGFQITSCQFALHYFFENKTVLHSFIRNLVECTSIQGYFIGTCFDGKQIFNLLKSKQNGENETIMSNDRKIFEITKLYHQTGFPDDDLSIGYAINVYQESINKVFREYLVNFDYFIRIMGDYGFVLVSKNEAQKMNLPDGSGLFSELFSFMENEIKRDPKSKNDYGNAINMSTEEKRISFLNRYFVFKKVRNVNVERIHKILANVTDIVKNVEDEIYEEEIEEKSPILFVKGPKIRLKLKKIDKQEQQQEQEQQQQQQQEQQQQQQEQPIINKVTKKIKFKLPPK